MSEGMRDERERYSHSKRGRSLTPKPLSPSFPGARPRLVLLSTPHGRVPAWSRSSASGMEAGSLSANSARPAPGGGSLRPAAPFWTTRAERDFGGVGALEEAFPPA